MDLSLSSSNSSSLANQPVKRLFCHYAFPAIAGMLVNGLYSTIDGIFIGQVVGTEGLAAMNLAWPIFGVIIGIGMMIGMGAAAHCSISRGEGKEEQAKTIIGNSLLLIVVISILQTISILLGGRTALTLMGAEGDLLELANSYLTYISFGSVVATAGAALPMVVRNDERPRLATAIIATGALVNIALDYILIMVFSQGVAGAAIATLIAQTITTVWSLAYLFGPKARLRIKPRHIGINFHYYWQILTTGFPSLTMFIYMSFVLAVHNRLFLEYGSVLSLAAFTIVGYIQAVYYMVAEGVANGIQPIVSFNKGSRNNQNIYTAIKLGAGTALVIGLVTVAIINLWPENIASVFDYDNPPLIKETALGLRLHLFTMYLDGFIVVAAAYFQALAKAKTATWITMGNMLVQIPLLIILPEWLGVTGVWLALPLSNIFLALAVMYTLRQDLKRRMRVQSMKLKGGTPVF